jgi:hypothetical protein
MRQLPNGKILLFDNGDVRLAGQLKHDALPAQAGDGSHFSRPAGMHKW